MKKLTMALCAAAALGGAATAAAENPAWTYGQIGYLRADSGDDATDGFRVKGSLGFAENFHAQAEYLDGSIGRTGSDTDFDGFRLVVGANPSVGNQTDAVFAAQYFSLTYDDTCGSGCDTDTDGFGVGVGVRHMLANNVELKGIAWWNEGENDPDSGGSDDFTDISIEIGGRYLFNDNFSGGVTVITNDSLVGGDSATIDLRYQFGDIL